MARGTGLHIDGETLEKYCTGVLPERRSAKVEEHLLVCEICRRSLAETESYVAAVRKAAAGLRRGARKSPRKAAQKAGGNR